MPVAPLAHPLPDDVVSEVRRRFREEGPIPAIKYLREVTNWGLKEAKEAVEDHLVTDEDRVAARQREANPTPRLDRTLVSLATYVANGEAWTSGTYRDLGCGCKVIGNGTTPHPLTVKQCVVHAAVRIPDPVRVARVAQEMSGQMIHDADRTRRAYVFCPEAERPVRWAAYQRTLRRLGYRDADAQDEVDDGSMWLGPEDVTVTLSAEEVRATLALIEDMSRFVGKMVLQDYARFNTVPGVLQRALKAGGA